MKQIQYIYLTQNDFIDGTYRIKKSGTYILLENIEFDFNNEYDYWPYKYQNNKYSDGYRDEYIMGFFAGITIECDTVIITLLFFEMKQSFKLYIEVGRSSTVEYLEGDYSHGRLLLYRLGEFENDLINDESISINTILFDNGDDEYPVTFSDIADKLEIQMESALNYAINRVNNKFVENDFLDQMMPKDSDIWINSEKLIINENGLPNTAVLYGGISNNNHDISNKSNMNDVSDDEIKFYLDDLTDNERKIIIEETETNSTKFESNSSTSDDNNAKIHNMCYI